jgi:PIN domain nuclease of toxin-antitoxin system
VNALLDTHTFLWTVTDDRRLSAAARDLIVDGSNECFLSAVSMWEIVLKANARKLYVEGGPAKFLDSQLKRNRFSTLAILPSHVFQAASLPAMHKDPFDRLLIAQAQVENLPLITADPEIRRYRVQVIW